MSPLFLRHAEKDVDEPTEGGGTSGPEPTGVQKCSLGYTKNSVPDPFHLRLPDPALQKTGQKI